MRAVNLQHKILSPSVVGIAIALIASFLFARTIVNGQELIVPMSVLLLLLVISIWKQNWLVYAFMIATTWFYNDWYYTEKPLIYIGYNIYLSDLFILLIVLATLFLIIANREHQAFQSKLGVAVSLYIGWIFLEILRGIPQWGGSALGESRFVIIACIYFPIVHSLKTIVQFKRFIKFYFVAILCFIVYVQLWRFFVQFKEDLVFMLHSRLLGPDLALLAASVFVFCLVFFLDGNIKKYKLFFFSVMIFFGFLIPLGSRTGFVAWVVGVVFVLIRKYRLVFFKLRISFIFVVLILAVLYWNTNILSPEENWDGNSPRTFSFLEEQRTGVGTTAWRLAGWATLLNKTLQGNIIFGEGLGGYYDIFEFSFGKTPPHNDWLIIFSKLGLIGLILFANIVFVFFKSGSSFLKACTNPIERSYMEGLMAVFVIGLVGGTFFLFFPFMWVVLGLQASLINKIK